MDEKIKDAIDEVDDIAEDMEVAETPEEAADNEEISEQEEVADESADVIVAKPSKNKKEKKAKTPAPKNVVAIGLIAIFLVIAGATLLSLAAYQLIFKPSYEKEISIEDLNFPYVTDYEEEMMEITPITADNTEEGVAE